MCLIDPNGRLSLIQCLLIHYKDLVVEEHAIRKSMEKDGVVNEHIGDRLVEELFQVPAGLDPELDKLIVQFSAAHQARELEIRKLKYEIDCGGVLGMKAKFTLNELLHSDQSEMRVIETKVAAAIKRGKKKAQHEVTTKSNKVAATEAGKATAHEEAVEALISTQPSTEG